MVLAQSSIERALQFLRVENRMVYFGVAAALFFYIGYMIVRKRKGLRRGHDAAEPEI